MSNVKSSKMQNSIQPSGIKWNKDAAARRNLLNKMFLITVFYVNKNVAVRTADQHDANLQLQMPSLGLTSAVKEKRLSLGTDTTEW